MILPNDYIVQIGAMDGVTHDPIHGLIHQNQSGVMYEPCPHMFARLKVRYANHPNLILKQEAVWSEDCVKTLTYTLDPHPDAQGMSTLTGRSNIHLFETLTVDVVCRRLTEHCDVLVIDAEGAEYEILKDYNHKPRVIMYEHNLLTVVENETLCHKFQEDYRISTQTRKDITWTLKY